MITYPQTKRVDVVEKPFGQTVSDPYRWLENDVRSDKEVAAWVESQNKVTNAHLDKLPGRDIFKERLKQLTNYEKFTIPVKKGGRYFYFRNSGLQNQRVLYVRDSVDGVGRVLIDPNSFDHLWGVVGNVGTKFFLTTTKDAPRLKVVTMDIATPDAVVRDVVPEQNSVLNDASLVGGRLVLSYLVDVKTEVRRYTLEGKADGVVKLPGIGTAIGFEGKEDDNETFFGFTSFNAPGTIYRYDVASNTARIWSEAKVATDLKQIAVEQRFYTSKDGTRVPMFIVRRKDVTGPAPTLLYAYGGYGLIDPPAFSPFLMAWVEQGGVFAIAYVRGGGEYGRAWHEAGRRLHKQNVFDDFIAAGEYLKAQGIASQDGLAIQGASNGGLPIGAVVNQ